MANKKQNIAIIGAGISGLCLANMLNSRANTKVFEKSRGVGGRMSTRYCEDFEFDHGAPFFTIKTQVFKDFMQPLIEEGVVSSWYPKIIEIDQDSILSNKDLNKSSGYYVGAPKMNAVCKYLSRQIDLYLNTEVLIIQKYNNKWQLFDRNNVSLGVFDWVISSAPALQTQSLLPNEFIYNNHLKSIKMSGCYALMLGFKNQLDINWDAAIVKNSNIRWIAKNSSKPGRETKCSIIALADSEWSDDHINDDIEGVKTQMIRALSSIVIYKSHDLIKCNIHRWRYSNIQANVQYQYLLDKDRKIAAIGDWCIKGRVESGFLSANALYNKIINLL